MKVIDSYLRLGLSVTEISQNFGLLPSDVRGELRKNGIPISESAEYDVGSQAIRNAGILSFSDWVKHHGPEPIKTQSRELGVSRSVIIRLYDAYRELIARPDRTT